MPVASKANGMGNSALRMHHVGLVSGRSSCYKLLSGLAVRCLGHACMGQAHSTGQCHAECSLLGAKIMAAQARDYLDRLSPRRYTSGSSGIARTPLYQQPFWGLAAHLPMTPSVKTGTCIITSTGGAVRHLPGRDKGAALNGVCLETSAPHSCKEATSMHGMPHDVAEAREEPHAAAPLSLVTGKPLRAHATGCLSTHITEREALHEQ